MSRNKQWYRSEDVVNHHTLKHSIKDCKKNTMWKDSMIEAWFHSEDFIDKALNDYYSESGFNHLPMFHTIISERGKDRLICSLTVEGRLVQKAINQNLILDAFRNVFIYDNAASLKGKGPDFALMRLKSFMEEAYSFTTKDNTLYALKIDMHNYFDSISHQAIYDRLEPYICHDKYLTLYFQNLLKAYQDDDYIHNGEHVPYGIGLGGEIPQSFGILMLDQLDHDIKEIFHAHWYIRYMDDIVIIAHDKDYLNIILAYVQSYLSQYNMDINEKKTKIIKLTPGGNQFKFLKIGFKIGKDGKIILLPNKNTRKRMLKKLRSFKIKLENGEMTFRDCMASFYASRGTLSRGNSYNMIQKVDAIFNDLFLYGFINDDDYRWIQKNTGELIYYEKEEI